MEIRNKTWLITGCSSGLGKALAQEVLLKGYNAVITARDQTDLLDLAKQFPQTALALSLDVTRQLEISAAVEQGIEKFGSIDVLVNNAGYGYRAAVEEGEEEQVRALFDTMFFGTVNVIKAVLPGMRAVRSGMIMNLSSIGGRFAAPGSGYYSGAKFAIEGMSDALRKELKPLGIKVVVVEPGAFRTDFAGRSLKGSALEISDYEQTVGPRRKENDQTHGTQPGDPKKAALVLIGITCSEDVPFRLLLGSDAVMLTRNEIDAQRREIDNWKLISETTDY